MDDGVCVRAMTSCDKFSMRMSKHTIITEDGERIDMW
jgi:hypothetical protein